MYLPHISGVTNHMRLYKRYFEARGHEVFLFTFGATDFADDEPNIVRSPALAWGNTGWNLGLNYNKRTRNLIPSLDIAHVHHPFQSGRLAAPQLKKHGIPIVFTNHSRYDLSADAYARAVPRALRHRVINSIFHQFTKDCALIVAPSNYTANWLNSTKNGLPVRVIHNGIETAGDFTNEENTAECVLRTPTPTRADFGFRDDDFVLCSVGRVAPEKNFFSMLDEFLRAANHNPQLRLLVIGDGPDLNKARAIAKASQHASSIVFAGQIPYEELPAIETFSDAFLTASLIESFGLAVVEALTAGLPVVAIKAAGIAENVTPGVSGLLADTNEPGALVTEILTLADDKHLRNKLSEGARQEAQRFALKYTAGTLLSCYEELLGV